MAKPATLKKEFVSKVISFNPAAPVDELLANPFNPRIHPDFQQQSLAGAIDEIGFADVIKVNLRTSELWGPGDRNVQTMLDGHSRTKILLRSGVKTAPTLYLDLTPDEERLFLISYDPLASMAEQDKQILDGLLQQVHSEDERVNSMLREIAEKENLYFDGSGDEGDDVYTRAIQAPIYIPRGPKPAITELYNDSKARALLDEIDSSDLDDDIKDFLRVAAGRHTVLNFKLIAEFYAQSPANIQALMENSGLVIIDFNRAIELGYVQLSQEIAKQYEIDYADA